MKTIYQVWVKKSSRAQYVLFETHLNSVRAVRQVRFILSDLSSFADAFVKTVNLPK